MNHYCTYFDRGFLIQGLALWRSLERHDPGAVLWVLALDEFAEGLLAKLDEPRLRVVGLAELERGDADLLAARPTRSRVEYFFTLSPCWPRWLLMTQPAIDRITYLDADLFFFSNPAPIFTAMDEARASVLVTGHRFPSCLRHYERHGRFNVGVLCFRNDAAGRDCLDDWRTRCLDWCYDRLEGDRYADQKYLDAWPARLGPALLVLEHAGVNAAPWNWGGGVSNASCDVRKLIVFHFARFRPIVRTRWWESGQLDYGVMPRVRRNAIYGQYWRALVASRKEIDLVEAGFDFPYRGSRLGREFLRMLPLRLFFGGVWLEVGGNFYNFRWGLGCWSGRALELSRRIVSFVRGGE